MPFERQSNVISAGLDRAEARAYERGAPVLHAVQLKEAMAFVRWAVANPSTAQLDAHPLNDETVGLLAEVVYTAMAGGVGVEDLRQLQHALCGGWGVPD